MNKKQTYLIIDKYIADGTKETFVLFHPDREEGNQLEWLPAANTLWQENGKCIPNQIVSGTFNDKF